MLGQEVVYDRVPYFFTDQYDLGMEYSGYAPPGAYDQVVVPRRPSRRAASSSPSGCPDGRVLAGMNVNVWDVTDPIQALVRRGTPVDPARLTDPSVALADLLAGSASAPGSWPAEAAQDAPVQRLGQVVAGGEHVREQVRVGHQRAEGSPMVTPWPGRCTTSTGSPAVIEPGDSTRR